MTLLIIKFIIKPIVILITLINKNVAILSNLLILSYKQKGLRFYFYLTFLKFFFLIFYL